MATESPRNPHDSPSSTSTAAAPRLIGRYAVYGEIARGGMATVHFGRLLGSVGFSRTVAIKRLHPQYASDPEFVQMFLEEARVATRIQHPNVVPTLDVVALEGELLLVMEYIQGESLSKLMTGLRARNEPIPLRIISAIVTQALYGLHAAHEAKTESGQPLELVHRDMSPQNLLVGVDGVARVLDFGIAKATGRSESTREGRFKGKLSYVAPEQVRGLPADRRTDLYSTAVVLWEMVTLKRLFRADSEWALLAMVRDNLITPPSEFVPNIDPALEALILRGLSGNVAQRYSTAREMAMALERIVPPASHREVADWLEHIAKDVLVKRAKLISSVEQSSQILLGDSGVRALDQILKPNSQPPSVTAPAIAGTLSHAIEAPKSNKLVPILLLGTTLGVGFGLLAWQISKNKSATGTVVESESGSSERKSESKRERAKEPSPPVREVEPAGGRPTEDVPSGPIGLSGSTKASASPSAAPTFAAKTPVFVRPKPLASTKPEPVPTAAAAAPSPVAPAPACSPPYTIDAAGIRHPKPECL